MNEKKEHEREESRGQFLLQIYCRNQSCPGFNCLSWYRNLERSIRGNWGIFVRGRWVNGPEGCGHSQQTLTTASYLEDEMAYKSLLHHYPSKSSIFSLPEREKEVC